MCYGCYFNDFQQEESGEKEYSSRENGSDWVWGLLGIKFEKKIQSIKLYTWKIAYCFYNTKVRFLFHVIKRNFEN